MHDRSRPRRAATVVRTRWADQDMPIDDEDEFDLYGDENENDSLPPDVTDVIDHLRDTLTPDMAARFIRGRFGHEPPDDPEQLEMVIEELIADAFNDGYEDWDRFPY